MDRARVARVNYAHFLRLARQAKLPERVRVLRGGRGSIAMRCRTQDSVRVPSDELGCFVLSIQAILLRSRSACLS